MATVDWSEVASAYDAGHAELYGVGPLGSGQAMFWVMPWAVAQAQKADDVVAPWGPPKANGLDPAERIACAQLYSSITRATVLLDGKTRSMNDSGMTQFFYPVQWAVTNRVAYSREDLAAELPRNLAVPHRLDPLAWARLGFIKTRRDAAAKAARPIPPVNGPLNDSNVQTWLKKYPDPALWHQMSAPGNLNYDLPATLKTFEWIVAQPACDRATAASLFLACYGLDVVGKTLAEVRRMDGCYHLVAKILQRSEGEGFARSDFTLSCLGLDDDQTQVLEEFRALVVPKDGLPRPERLLGTVFTGKPAVTATTVHSETWITRERGPH